MSDYTMRLPDVGEGVAEAEIVEWHVAVGDHIAEDDIVVDVMSDKATVELPSPIGGTVRWIAGSVGDVIAVGSDLVRIDVSGEEQPDEHPNDVEGDVAPTGKDVEVADLGAVERTADRHAPFEPPDPRRPQTPVAPIPVAVPPSDPSAPRPTAAPAVRARARDLGIELDDVRGTGPGGRVLHGDLDALLRSASSLPAAASTSPTRHDDVVDEVAVIGLRRNIAERMQVSARRIPHFTYVEEVDVTAIEQLRTSLNADHDDRTRLSLLPFLIRAMVVAIRSHPEMNACFDDEAGVVRRHRAVHLGVATQTERGLMVPVVDHADELGLWALATEISRLADAARTARITLAELTGSTITITSLGALGGIVSTPIINAPEVAIVGVNKIADRATVVDGAIVVRKIMNLSSSFDHRVVDGADAASFIQLVRQLIETPARIFVD